jgi:hypothetical protein
MLQGGASRSGNIETVELDNEEQNGVYKLWTGRFKSTSIESA